MHYLYSLLISVLTLYYASFASLREENFTGIANNLNHHLFFKFWVLITSIYFFMMTLRLFKKNQWCPKYLKAVSIIIMVCINLAPYIPYQENLIHLNALHVLCAMGSSILYLVLWQLFLLDMRLYHTSLYEKLATKFQMLIFTLVIVLLTFGNVNSLCEVILVCGFSFFIAYASQQQ